MRLWLLMVLWHFAFKLVVQTLMTYFFLSPAYKIADLSEIYSNLEIITLGFSTGLFLVALHLFYPVSLRLAGSVPEQLWNRRYLQEHFLPSFPKGVLLGVIWVAACMTTGEFEYMGYLVHSEDQFTVFMSVLLRATSLFLLIYGEEFLYRGRILGLLTERWGAPFSIALTSLLYGIGKILQFGWGWQAIGDHAMGLVTLLLISTALGIRAHIEKSFYSGAGLYFGLLLLLHTFLGLPLLDSEYSGVFLIKYVLQSGDAASDTLRFLTGAERGPLASFLWQLIFGLECLRLIAKYRRNTHRKFALRS